MADWSGTEEMQWPGKEIQETRPAQKTPFKQSMTDLTDWLSGGLAETSAAMARAGVSGTEIPIEPVENITPADVAGMKENLRPFAKFVVPQNEVQALAMLLTGGTGRLAANAGLKGLKAAGTRIAGGIVGGGIGGALSEEGAGQGAVEGGLAALFAEGVGSGLSKLARLTRKGHLQRLHTARIGEHIEKTVPEIGGARTPAQLGEMAFGEKAGVGRLREPFKALEAKYGDVEVLVPALDENPLPLREVLKEISKLGPKGYSGTKANVVTRTAQGMDARALRGEILDELGINLSDPAIISPGAGRMYSAARETFKKGSTYLSMLRSPGVMAGGPKGPTLDLPSLGSYLSKNREKMRQALGEDVFNDLSNLVLRGGELGAKDLPLESSGGFVSFLRNKIGRRYAGTPPYTIPAGAQTAADITAERRPKETALGAAAGGVGIYEALKAVPTRWWFFR